MENTSRRTTFATSIRGEFCQRCLILLADDLNRCPDDFETRTRLHNSVSDLENSKQIDEQALRLYLNSICQNAGGDDITFEATKYAPYTADLCVTVNGNKRGFGEVKTYQAEIIGQDVFRKLVTIKHQSRHRKRPLHFTYASGRWMHLFSEVSSPHERFSYAGANLPAVMILLHRDDIPQDWWNRDVHYHIGQFNIECVIDLRGRDAGQQILRLLERGFSRESDSLPQLEDPSTLTADELRIVAGVGQPEDGVENGMEDQGLSDACPEVDKAKVFGDASAKMALQFLQDCGLW